MKTVLAAIAALGLMVTAASAMSGGCSTEGSITDRDPPLPSSGTSS